MFASHKWRSAKASGRRRRAWLSTNRIDRTSERRGEPVASRLRADIPEPCFQRLRTALEQRRVIHGVRQHVLDVIAGFGERNGFSKNRALYRCAKSGTPLRWASRASVVTGGGENGGIVELVVDHRQIIRAEQDIRVEVVHLFTRYRSHADFLRP